MEDQLYYNMFQDRLERELLKICTDAGMLSGILLRSDDIDLKWKELPPEYIADGVQVMFSIGAAIELHRLGYEMKKLQ